MSEHIVIGTPGKLVDWIYKFKSLDLRNCKVFVLDEADVMIATQGHQVGLTSLHDIGQVYGQWVHIENNYKNNSGIIINILFPFI